MNKIKEEPIASSAPQKKDEIKKMQEKMEELEAQTIEYLAGWQRARADYQNLLKETDKRLEDFRKYSQEDLLTQLFPLVDYFKQAFSKIPEKEQNSPWLTGIKHLQNYLNKVLQDNSVEELEVMGKEFDPALHEVVKEEESEEPEGTIIAVCQTGFNLNGKLVQPAKVIVAKKINN